MENTLFNRRKFMTMTTKAATGVALLSTLPKNAIAEKSVEQRIKFSVININHNHIYGMTDAVTSARQAARGTRVHRVRGHGADSCNANGRCIPRGPASR